MIMRFLHAGDAALVVEFGDRIDRELNERVLRLSARVRAARLNGVVETVPTFRSLMVLYDPVVTDGASLAADIEGLEDSGEAPRQATLWRIPACYEGRYAPDLEDVAQRTGLTTDGVAAMHAATRFNVYMVGFVPGFPYMGDLPRSLALPRRTDPRVRVPAGSIAIASNMTAIYPVESPGGWHLIGSTPVRLFDLRAARPALLSPGDEVAFQRITADEFETIRAAVAADTYRVPSEPLTA
jgi:inhibitor of KinA